MSTKSKNEKIKRTFLRRLREAEGLAESTIVTFERSLSLYDEFSRDLDYVKFNQKRAVQFKAWLQDRQVNGKALSIPTIHSYLRLVRTFFTWLSGQPGYKSAVSLDAVSYLTLDRKSVREAVAPRQVNVPILSYVRKLVDSIEPRNNIDRRDRALIAFLLLSGMRDQAVATLPLGCFDHESLAVSQDPKRGVKTKFGKTIHSVLFQFDKNLIRVVVDWAEYLTTELCFSESDPLFPQTQVEQAEGGLSFQVSGIKPEFWSTTEPIRQILRTRSEASGLKYYHPHSFRHAAVHLAMSCCTSGEQMKAVSQNLGHEHIGTTVMTYGTLDPTYAQGVVAGIDFEQNEYRESEDEIIEDLMKKLNRLKGRRRPGKNKS